MNELRLPRGRVLSIANKPAVMGILNVTPDSFSDGGVHFEHAKALHAAMQMEEDGAAVIDIGGESTRPGADPVSVEEEIERVVPLIRQIRERSDVAVSVDTRKSAVAQEAISAGADILNDVSALRYSKEMAALAAKAGIPVVLMHMRGEPATMQQYATYGDVVHEVSAELREFVRAARAAGIEQVLIDPGIGFAKTYEHNLQILAHIHQLTMIADVVIGASRKAFIGHITGRSAGRDRAIGSLAAVAAAHRGGAAFVRVHDVRETVDFLKVLMAIEERG